MRAWPPPSAQPRGRPTRSSTSRRRWRTTTCSRPTGRWARRCGARAPSGPRTRPASSARSAARAQTIRWGFEANENTPVLRTHDRFGHRIDEVEFHPSWHELMRIGVGHGLHALALARARARRPRRARGDVHAADAGRGRRRLPDLDDLLGDPRAAHSSPSSPRSGSRASSRSTTTERLVPADRQARRALRHGDDREAGRLRRPRQHHPRDAAERRRARRRVRAHRPQVVLLGADVRRVPRPRPDRRRALLLPDAALDARRRAQRLPHPAAQGQARQPLQRLQRGRVPRRLGAHGRRGGPRRADDHRDGQPHPARLRDRLRRRLPRRASRRPSTTPPTAPPSASCWSTSR